jgi:hypothetical protein
LAMAGTGLGGYTHQEYQNIKALDR